MLGKEQTTSTRKPMSREDRDAWWKLVQIQRKREELRLLEQEFNQIVMAFGQRHGFLGPFYREHHMRDEFRRRGYEA